MNRKQRREYVKKMKKDMVDSGILRNERQRQIEHIQKKFKKEQIPEGTKVKLRYKQISERFNDKTNPIWMEWIKQHKDDIFTVEYEEKHKEKKAFCVFKEDTSPVKWLWFCEDLEIVKG